MPNWVGDTPSYDVGFEGSIPGITVYNAMTIPQLALQAVRALGIQKPVGFDGTFATFHLLAPLDRVRVTNYSREYVKANPEMFTPATVGVANQLGMIEETLIDDSIQWEDFVDEVGANANNLLVTPIVNVGKTASAVAYILPFAAVFVGYLLIKGKLKL